MVAVINVDSYPFLAFADQTYYPEDTEISAFRLHRAVY